MAIVLITIAICKSQVLNPGWPLSAEIGLVLSGGNLRGADLWHLATALFAAEDPATVTFLTLDKRQGAVAAKLGLRTDVNPGGVTLSRRWQTPK